MTHRGKMTNGVVVLENPDAIPDGTTVTVRPLKGRAPRVTGKEGPPSLYDRYKRFAGAVKDLPSDMSVNLDHYLYGAPKRK